MVNTCVQANKASKLEGIRDRGMRWKVKAPQVLLERAKIDKNVVLKRIRDKTFGSRRKTKSGLQKIWTECAL